MYLTVIRSERLPSAWGGLPAFGRTLRRSPGWATDLESRRGRRPRQGRVTEQKAAAKATLIDATMVMAGALKAYAVTAGDRLLEGKVKFTDRSC